MYVKVSAIYSTMINYIFAVPRRKGNVRLDGADLPSGFLGERDASFSPIAG